MTSSNEAMRAVGNGGEAERVVFAERRPDIPPDGAARVLDAVASALAEMADWVDADQVAYTAAALAGYLTDVDAACSDPATASAAVATIVRTHRRERTA